MRLQRRNLQSVWYCLFDKEVPVFEDGYETGEKDIAYHDPVEMRCNVSPASGYAQLNTFGNLDSYDKVLLIDLPTTRWENLCTTILCGGWLNPLT